MARQTREGEDEWVGRVRALVSSSVYRTSLRAVAREIGVSPSGLEKFLAGSAPYNATRQKLLRWSVRHGSAPGDELPATEAETIIYGMVSTLPPSRRGWAVAEVVRMLAEIYRHYERPAPAWLEELVEKWAPCIQAHDVER